MRASLPIPLGGAAMAGWTIALLSLLASGCSNQDAWHAETVPAEGQIRINGQVPDGAIVTLFPTGDAVDVRESKPWGVVGDDGTYTLRTYHKDDGAPLGEYRATVVWRENPSIPGSPDMLAGAYDEPHESQWTFEIEAGQTELPPIEITEAKVNPRGDRGRQKPSPFEETAAAD